MHLLAEIKQQIIDDPTNEWAKKLGYGPLYAASDTAKIVVVGHAPGIKAQTSMIPWDDASGKALREWLGTPDEQFYDESLVALLPMDFYFPGKNEGVGKTGDLPPRPDFAPRWHPLILQQMPDVELFILVGQYAQKYYLGKDAKKNLTETVRAYEDYLPKFFPIVHPSPLNFRWQGKNPWFKQQVIPVLQKTVQNTLQNT